MAQRRWWAWGTGLCALVLWGCGGGNTSGPPSDPPKVEEPDAGSPAPSLVPPPPTISSFAASATKIALGEKVTLAWQQTGATALSIAPGVGPVPAATTSKDVAPTQTTTYTLTATNDGGATTSPSVTVTVGPPHPVSVGAWTYYDTGQGLSKDIHDVSADEGGNVYVAGGDALYVKTRTDEQFLRFTSENGGLSKNCQDEKYAHCGFSGTCTAPPLPGPLYQCLVQAVAGGAPGRAVIGFKGFGDEIQDYTDWASQTGGADVVAFDPEKKTLTRTRHVWIASPPHTICTSQGESRWVPGDPACTANDGWWRGGRRLVRNILRVAVNHDVGSPKYGDVWFCGEHGTFSALMNNANGQRYLDRTIGFESTFADQNGIANAKDVWEHEHPSLHDKDNPFINEKCWGLSIAPDGTPWATNQYRTAYLDYPAYSPTDDRFGLAPYVSKIPGCTGTGPGDCSYAGFDLWPDPPNAASSSGQYYPGTWNFDAVVALSHCQDGTLWVGSYTHGLARIDGSGVTTDFGWADPALRNPIQSIACDPLDSSVWIGFQDGRLGRLRTSTQKLEFAAPTGAPDFTKHIVQSIQIDRWAGNGKRIVYFAFTPVVDASGAITSAGGLASYSGP